MNPAWTQIFSWALWLAGIGHFILIIAGSQVPRFFDWKNELAKLRPFNRKFMRVYWAFTGMTIIAFGLLTLFLHDELLQGDLAALGLALFIGIFWTVRILIDAFFFDHKDWPKGKQYVLGHVLLTSLFVFLASTYLGLVIWHGWVL